MDEQRRRIRDKIFSSTSRELVVVSIHGGPGSGKTHFAQLLFNDPMEHSFAFRAWISADAVTTYELEDVLKSWLCYLDPSMQSEISNMTDGDLKTHIIKELGKKRYLIVVDGVLSYDTWEHLKSHFPDNKNGSRVIVTTRDKEVAKKVDKAREHLSSSLSDNEKRICCGFQDGNGERGRIMTMYELPIELVIISGMFDSTYSGVTPSVLSLRSLPWFCYEGLQYEDSRKCFLCLAQFPPEKPISVEKLGLLLMADREEEADQSGLPWDQKYLNELTKRKLVVKVENSDAQVSERFASFKIHRSIQENFQAEAQDKKFLEVLPHPKLSLFKQIFQCEQKKAEKPVVPKKAEKLVVHLNELTSTDRLPHTDEAKHLKSVLIFDVRKKNGQPASVSDQSERVKHMMMKFGSTKVLEFNGVDFRSEKLKIEKERSGQAHVAKLEKLKYLSFQGCHLDELKDITKICPSLETLDLRVKNEMTIPNFLHELTNLKHLYLPQNYKPTTECPKLNLSKLTKLRILENCRPQRCDCGDWTMFEQLQSLTVIIDYEREEDRRHDRDYNEIKGLIHAIQGMTTTLCHVALVLKNIYLNREERIQAMKDVLKCNAIHILEVVGKFEGSNFASLGPIEFGGNLTKMVFSHSNFKKCPWSRSQVLSNLKSLVMCDDAFAQENMEFPSVCFPKLTCLELKHLHVVKKLTVEEGALSSLVVLKIVNCEELKYLCEELDKLKNLERLILGLKEMDKFQNQVDKKICLLPAIDDY